MFCVCFCSLIITPCPGVVWSPQWRSIPRWFMHCFGHFPQQVVCVLCNTMSGGEMVERVVVVLADQVFYQFTDAIKCCFMLRVTRLLPAVSRLSAFLYKFHYFLRIACEHLSPWHPCRGSRFSLSEGLPAIKFWARIFPWAGTILTYLPCTIFTYHITLNCFELIQLKFVHLLHWELW